MPDTFPMPPHNASQSTEEFTPSRASAVLQALVTHPEINRYVSVVQDGGEWADSKEALSPSAGMFCATWNLNNMRLNTQSR